MTDRIGWSVCSLNKVCDRVPVETASATRGMTRETRGRITNASLSTRGRNQRKRLSRVVQKREAGKINATTAPKRQMRHGDASERQRERRGFPLPLLMKLIIQHSLIIRHRKPTGGLAVHQSAQRCIVFTPTFGFKRRKCRGKFSSSKTGEISGRREGG